MAYVCIVIETNEDVDQSKAKVAYNAAGNSPEGLVSLRNYLDSAVGSIIYGSAQVTVRDTDPGVTTHGTGSVQVSYNIGK